MIDPWPKSGDIRVIQSVACEVGKPIFVTEAYRNGGPIAIAAHPLDVIAMKYARDPLTRLEVAMAWILCETEWELDKLLDRILIDTGRRGL